tara:strand:+ start:219 stop:440 length:222 start_codon:yes stop_codon:yes gene_type:complete
MKTPDGNLDPFLAADAIKDIDDIVNIFIQESKEGEINERTLHFLNDLSVFCKRIYYKEPSEIELAIKNLEQEK